MFTKQKIKLVLVSSEKFLSSMCPRMPSALQSILMVCELNDVINSYENLSKKCCCGDQIENLSKSHSLTMSFKGL